MPAVIPAGWPGRRARLIIKPVPVPELGGDPLPHILRRLGEAGIECDVTVTQPGRPVALDVREALDAARPPELLIAAGGDGTHGAAGAALVGSGVPLGLISLGTFNNLARSLGIPRHIEAALDVIIAGHARPVDAGRVNGRVFFECAGAGWDATLYPLGEHLKSGRVGSALRALGGLLGYSTCAITLLLDGRREICSKTPTVLIANGPFLGSSFAVAPTSRLDDGLLTVMLFEGFSRTDLLTYFAAVAEGRAREDWRVVSHRASKVEVTSPGGLPAHADGQPIGPLATSFEALPQAILAIAPPDGIGVGRRQALTTRWPAPVVSAPAPATPSPGFGVAARPEAVQPGARTMRWRVAPKEPPGGPGGGASG